MVFKKPDLKNRIFFKKPAFLPKNGFKNRIFYQKIRFFQTSGFFYLPIIYIIIFQNILHTDGHTYMGTYTSRLVSFEIFSPPMGS